jgi:hypothetical protein
VTHGVAVDQIQHVQTMAVAHRGATIARALVVSLGRTTGSVASTCCSLDGEMMRRGIANG